MSREHPNFDDRHTMKWFLTGVIIVLGFAVLAVSCVPLHAEPVCSTDTHQSVVERIQRKYNEHLLFVGAYGSEERSLPMEFYVSDTGTWTMIVITPQGVCVLAVGLNYQTVEH